jgi:hypothetical protein
MLNLSAETILTAFTDNLTTSAEDNTLSGDLDITDDLEIVGLGANASVIHANAGDRVTEVHNGATVTLRNLGLTGSAAIADGPGGGLHNNGGAVLLDRVAVSNNRSGGGALRLIASSVTGNSTIEGGGGGGISNGATLVLENVTLSGNHAGNSGGLLAQGGAAILPSGAVNRQSG